MAMSTTECLPSLMSRKAEGVAQVIRDCARETDGVGCRIERAPSPVLPIVQLPHAAARGGEDERVLARPARREAPLGEVLAKRAEQLNGPRRPIRLLALELAMRDGRLDEQRALAHV